MGIDGTMSIVSNRQLKTGNGTENRGLQGREVPKIGGEVTECALFQRGHVRLIGGK
jgi:hypothetical protein